MPRNQCLALSTNDPLLKSCALREPRSWSLTVGQSWYSINIYGRRTANNHVDERETARFESVRERDFGQIIGLRTDTELYSGMSLQRVIASAINLTTQDWDGGR